MNTDALFSRTSGLVALAATLCCPLLTLAQGSLVPSGSPAPIMKTLDQVEARIPIAVPTNITESGSYYFTTNVIVPPGETGITIYASDVALDLNGYTLRSLGVVGANGILVSGARTNLTVRNGTLRDWGAAISAASCENGRFERLQLINNGTLGLLSGPNSRINDSTVLGGDNAGLLMAYGSRVDDCTVQRSRVGIVAGYGSVVSGCTVNESPDTAISTGSHSVVVECAVTGPGTNGIVTSVSSVTRCTVGNLDGVGINAGDVSTVADCVVQNTKSHGIQASSGGVIQRNTLSNIGVNTNAAAIHVTSSGNRIEGNNISFCSSYGLRVTASGNVIIQNNVRNTAGGYSEIAVGNEVGPIQSPASSTSPWANFGF